jgi:hypothetical protein
MPLELSRGGTDGAPNQGDPARPSAVMRATVVSPVRTTAQRLSSTQTTSSSGQSGPGSPGRRGRAAVGAGRRQLAAHEGRRPGANVQWNPAGAGGQWRHGLRSLSAPARLGIDPAQAAASAFGWVTSRRPPASAVLNADASRTSVPGDRLRRDLAAPVETARPRRLDPAALTPGCRRTTVVAATAAAARRATRRSSIAGDMCHRGRPHPERNRSSLRRSPRGLRGVESRPPNPPGRQPSS